MLGARLFSIWTIAQFLALREVVFNKVHRQEILFRTRGETRPTASSSSSRHPVIQRTLERVGRRRVLDPDEELARARALKAEHHDRLGRLDRRLERAVDGKVL